MLRGIDIKGLGPKRIEAIADCFGTIWTLLGADLEEIAAVPNIPRSLAEELSSILQ